MSLSNVKVGDLVVAVNLGMGTVTKLDETEIPVCVYFAEYKEWWFRVNGSFASDTNHTTCCWPVHSAPGWIWGALGIKNPSNYVCENDLTGEYHTDCNLLLARTDVLRTMLAEVEEELAMLKVTAMQVVQACYHADAEGDLSDRIDGQMLFKLTQLCGKV